MAMNDFAGNRHQPPAAGRIRKPWAPLVLVLAATTVLASAIKAIGILLPYINSQLF